MDKFHTEWFYCLKKIPCALRVQLSPYSLNALQPLISVLLPVLQCHKEVCDMRAFRTGFFHLAIYIKGLSLFLNDLIAHPFVVTEKDYIVRMYNLFNHSPIQGHLGCFQCLVIMNKAALNIRMLIFVCI